ncbi:MAG: hypothetical protein M9890_04960 [Thermomicrobiales bacterium]|nr:hypothetical protein [Thermomicrobiales bacterium]
MQAEQTLEAPAYSGTDEQKALAAEIFQIFRIQGRFFSDTAPIRLSLTQLTQFMEQAKPKESKWSARIDDALSANSDVFAREGDGDDVAFVTTRVGNLPHGTPGKRGQVLTTRFATPEPRRAAPARKSAVAPASSLLGVVESETLDAPTEETDAPAAAATPVAQSALEVEPASASDDDLATAIRHALDGELSVARWGDKWIAEDRVHRFSRGDFRRIEDLIREHPNGTVTDAEIADDIVGVRSNSDNYAQTLFAINYRLSHEQREFEFLGSAEHGIWALANPAAIGTSKRKASELGQDYRVLLEFGTAAEPAEEGLVEHILSFYEYTYGVLPYDSNLRTIMPSPGFKDQRAARITFESPQTSDIVQAELRFPTGNRGGFIAGLENFFAENLIPGAVLTIEKTDTPLHFLLEYFQVSGEDRKLLHLDDKKNVFAYRPTTFYCATQDEFVLSDNRFPRLVDLAPLDERTKRHPEQVVVAAFERAGENLESAENPRFFAMFSDLLTVANIERPMPADLLRNILTSGEYAMFSADETTEDAYFYTPVSGAE